jgi:hypothetical protein
MNSEDLARQLTRANLALTEKDQLIRHHQIALDLVTIPGHRDQLISSARATVARWRSKRLCSRDHIERWNEILNMEPTKMAITMVSAVDGWGPILRQNSPWVDDEELEATVGIQSPNSSAHLYGVLTVREIADRLKCSPEAVYERTVAGEFILLSSPSRVDDRRYPAFQLDERVDKSLLKQTIQKYRDADINSTLLWSFLRAPLKIYVGLTAIEILLGDMPRHFEMLTLEERSWLYLDVVDEEISRVRW